MIVIYYDYYWVSGSVFVDAVSSNTSATNGERRKSRDTGNPAGAV